MSELNLKKLPKPFKAKWLKALRSGDYKQARQFLRTEKGFCCLGVACDISGKNAWDPEPGKNSKGRKYYYTRKGASEELPGQGDIPQAALEALSYRPFGSTDDAMGLLTMMNDKGKKFTTIADWIEKNL